MAPDYTRRNPLFRTERLYAVVGNVTDVDFFFRLWTNPQVMVNVGFPQGLKISRPEIAAILQKQEEQILDARLLVILESTGQPIGECKLGMPDNNGLSTTDVKLLPQFWGNKHGVEIKKALVEYLFRHTDCEIVEATPNVNNIASIKMQEAVGGILVGERNFQPPDSMREFARPVHSYVYHVYRNTWASL